jgi:oligoendopeptidase F
MSIVAYEPKVYPHQWLPAEVDLTTWELIEPWFRQLLERPIDFVADLETWLRDMGELNAAVSQEGVRRYVAMTCQTDDPEREAAYLQFIREVEPKLKPLANESRSKYLDSPHRTGLDPETYRIYDRAQENRRALYREANVPRETKLAELEQKYQKIMGAMTVQFRDKERTPAQMAPFLEENDLATRQEAWVLVARRRLEDAEALDSLFEEMLALRIEVAREAGFDNYVHYAYKARERFDYGEAEAEGFHDGIERAVVPLTRALLERRKQLLKVDPLRPWDLTVDPLGREPLRPFQDSEQLGAGVQRIFEEIDPELGGQFAFLRARGLLDLANRKGKSPGGYQTTYEDDRLPFIFMNAVGIDGDLRTLLHEGGHAFHSLACRDLEFAPYRDCPIEFCEVASMSMELLGARDLVAFYDDADAARSYRQLLEGTISILPWIATVDAFQHWLYRNPNHDRDQRRTAWLALLDRFGGGVDWTGHEDARALSWHRQLHIFLYPFYYIEYGIAQLGALQVWMRARTDRVGAVASYRSALALGGSRGVPDLFEAAGIQFDFSEKGLRPLVEAVQAELDRLPE